MDCSRKHSSWKAACTILLSITHQYRSTCTDEALSESRAGHCPEMHYNINIIIQKNYTGSKSLQFQVINRCVHWATEVIGVTRPAIVREIPHFGLFPAFPHFCENVPHFWLYFGITKIAENRNNCCCTEIFCSKKLSENVNNSVT